MIDCVVAPVDHKNDVPAEAVRVTLPPLQNVVGPLDVIVAVGTAFTATVVEVLALQPFTSVTWTEYVVVEVGDTVIDADVAPVDQRNVVPPVAVSVALAPLQIAVGPVIVAVGNGLTVIICDAEFGQPRASATVTV